jgi:hypothetical protein
MDINTVSDTRSFPVVLKFTDIRSYVFTAVFVLLSVLVPYVFHQFHLAGPTYLPMHIFVLAAGLLFGWRAGLVVGLATPLTSFAITGMPVAAILPQIVVELAAYGLLAGIMREKARLPVIWSLLAAMIGGRLAMLVAVSVISFVLGQSNSPLGTEAGSLFVLISAVKLGWPGILIQLALLPPLVLLIEKFMQSKRAQE